MYRARSERERLRQGGKIARGWRGNFRHVNRGLSRDAGAECRFSRGGRLIHAASHVRRPIDAPILQGVPRRHTGETLRYGRVRGHNGRESRGAAAPNSSVTTYHVHVAFQACRYIGDAIRPLRVMHTRRGMVDTLHPVGAFLCKTVNEKWSTLPIAAVTPAFYRQRFDGANFIRA